MSSINMLNPQSYLAGTCDLILRHNLPNKVYGIRKLATHISQFYQKADRKCVDGVLYQSRWGLTSQTNGDLRRSLSEN